MTYLLYATVHGTVLHYACARVRYCAHDGNIMTDLLCVLTRFILRLLLFGQDLIMLFNEIEHNISEVPSKLIFGIAVHPLSDVKFLQHVNP